MEQFYQVLKGVLLETGIAVLNDEYDPTVEWRADMQPHLQKKCCEIVILKPERLASTDETEGTCNQS
eukprot:372535-Rhodomonas_salina.1